jgi:hypothetical protein
MRQTFATAAALLMGACVIVSARKSEIRAQDVGPSESPMVAQSTLQFQPVCFEMRNDLTVLY